MMFSIKDFFSKCDQICSLMRIWSHLLKKLLMKNFIFRAVLDFARIIMTYFNPVMHNVEKWPNTGSVSVDL